MSDFPRRGDNFQTLRGPGRTDAPGRIVRELVLEPDGLNTDDLATRLGLSPDDVIGHAADLASVAVLDFQESPFLRDWVLGPLVAAALARRLSAAKGVEIGDWIPAA